ncbi:MAG TPA: class I SAM-dependent methyltransferase [Telluria sp.]|jgi:predicted methyltransferase
MQPSLRFAPVLLALCAALAGGTAFAQSGTPSASQASQAYQAALASPIRTPADRKTDERRKPAQFLAFAEVHPGMKAFDIASGGGTTAALLTAAVGPNGQVWAQNSKPNAKLSERIGDATVPNLHAVVSDFNDPIPKGTPPLDLVTINMNYHDIVNTPTDRTAMNKHLYDALKPGGHLVIVDNSAKPGSGLSATKTLHRIDEDTLVQEITRAGFKVEARSDYLRAPADPRTQAFFDMNGVPDDKFAVRFVKP